jgi:hypothetical protein
MRICLPHDVIPTFFSGGDNCVQRLNQQLRFGLSVQSFEVDVAESCQTNWVQGVNKDLE